MEPIEFEEANVVFGKDQPPYLPLPAYCDDVQGGRIFHCWQLSWWERFKILFTGRLWISVLTFNKKLQPIKPMADNPFYVEGDAVEENNTVQDACHNA